MSEDLFTLPGDIRRTAVFSECRQWRYELWRRWDDSKPYCVFVCLNPSTADETKDDNTVRRCIDYAQRWGYGAFCMLNIFAYRATQPKNMKAFPKPIGALNDETLKRVCADAGIVVAAWGTHGTHLRRNLEVLAFLPRLHALQVTAEGHPNHPLYLKKSLTPIPYEG